MAKYERHIFVCENERPADDPRGCCKDKGGVELRAAFKAALERHRLRGAVRANKAGCLDACPYGATVVVYPEAVWYGGVTVDDVEEIIQSHIIGGNPVERLRITRADYRWGPDGPPKAAAAD